MLTVLIVIHIMVAVSLIGLILLQKTEGNSAGGGFSVSSMTAMMQPRARPNPLSRATTVLGIGFFVTSLGQALTQLLSFLLAVSLFYVVYKYASIRRLPWRAALLASGITAVLFEVAKRLFGWYLRFALVNSVSVDANVGALILFVVWLYYTALVFLIGGVIAETWDLRVRQRRQEAVLA